VIRKPHDREAFELRLQKLPTTLVSRVGGRSVAKTNSGAVVDVLLTAGALADESGAVCGVAVTERRMAPKRVAR